jgi:heat shock protein HtpX
MPTTYSFIAANRRRSWLLFGAFFVVFAILGWIFGALSDAGWLGLALALLIATVMSLVSYFGGDRVALFSSGARPTTKESEIYLYRIIENLTITAGLPMPKVYIIEDGAINAFATGRDPKHASIAVTRGCIQQLENEELEGVLAHELSHIQNYDIRYITLVVILVGAVGILSNFFLRSQWLFGRRSSRDSGQAGTILFLIGLLFAILAPIVAQLIKFAISRRREYLADASGALLTRYPEGLAKALEKIAASPEKLHSASDTTAPLYFANPFGSRRLKGMFSTHPPIEDRIRALRTLAS